MPIAKASLRLPAPLLLLCLAAGCADRTPVDRLALPPGQLDSLNLPDVAPERVWAALVGVVGSEYGIAELDEATSSLRSSPAYGISRQPRYLTDLIVPGARNARRVVHARVAPMGDGSRVLISVRMQQQDSAPARQAMYRTTLADRPGHSPADRGDYAPTAQAELWQDTGPDRDEQQRLLLALQALVAGKEPEPLDQPTQAPPDSAADPASP